MSVYWKNWRTIDGDLKEDSHHAEIVDIGTGEVVSDSSISSDWDKQVTYEVMNRNRYLNYLKGRRIHRSDVGDCFGSLDYSKF